MFIIGTPVMLLISIIFIYAGIKDAANAHNYKKAMRYHSLYQTTADPTLREQYYDLYWKYINKCP